MKSLPVGEGNGNPLQYSCLKKPLDRGAGRATVQGVAEPDTTEQLTQEVEAVAAGARVHFIALPSPAGSRVGRAAPGRQGGSSTRPHPFWKSSAPVPATAGLGQIKDKGFYWKKKNLPVVQETWAQSRGREDPPEKDLAAHSSVLAWRIPWTEEPGGLQSRGVAELETAERLTLIYSITR